MTKCKLQTCPFYNPCRMDMSSYQILGDCSRQVGSIFEYHYIYSSNSNDRKM